MSSRSIWYVPDLSLKKVASFANRNMGQHLGISWLEIGSDYLVAKLPVDDRTTQPMDLLHGGASCVLAEALGSVAANLTVDESRHIAVGLEINANHIRSVQKGGAVIGTARPVHLGKTTQVWDIRIEEEDSKKLVCVSRLTVAIRQKELLSSL